MVANRGEIHHPDRAIYRCRYLPEALQLRSARTVSLLLDFEEHQPAVWMVEEEIWLSTP